MHIHIYIYIYIYIPGDLGQVLPARSLYPKCGDRGFAQPSRATVTPPDAPRGRPRERPEGSRGAQ